MALVGAAVVGITSLSLAKLHSVSVGSMKANTIALQAYQYADAEAQLVRATAYNDLSAKAKADIQNSNGFQSEVTLSAESNYSDTVKQKIATVKIYRTGESTPRISLDVKRLSKEVKADSVPSGTILPWYGALGSIPTGYALCNGSNGTPDLRNRFLVGAGSSYNLGSVGGSDVVTLTLEQIPSHNHTMWLGRDWSQGYNATGFKYGESGISNAIHEATHHLVTEYSGGSQAHENRPPYYAVYYIMKL